MILTPSRNIGVEWSRSGYGTKKPHECASCQCSIPQGTRGLLHKCVTTLLHGRPSYKNLYLCEECAWMEDCGQTSGPEMIRNRGTREVLQS